MSERKFTVLVHFDNGHINRGFTFESFPSAMAHAANCVSHTGCVRRIEIEEPDGIVRALWDRSWTPESKARGLELPR